MARSAKGIGPPRRALTRIVYFYPDKYVEKHYSRGIRAKAGHPAKLLFAIRGAKVSHPG
jgi:hypothetical protein